MARKNFAQILKENRVDIQLEYERLFQMFYEKYNYKYSFYNVCNMYFHKLPFRKTCISLSDFEECHDLFFEECPREFNLDYFVTFSEYIYNLARYNMTFSINTQYDGIHLREQIDKVIELIGYMKAEEDGVEIFVPKSQSAIAVAEMLPANLSYKVIEYNHHSMKNDLERKRAILKLLADQLEDKKNDLKNVNKQLASDLFYMLNNLNIRHNNADKVKSINQSTLEEWYDYTYDLCLLAFMTLENKDHKQRILEIKKELGDV